jgi:hypothetical protein
VPHNFFKTCELFVYGDVHYISNAFCHSVLKIVTLYIISSELRFFINFFHYYLCILLHVMYRKMYR